MALADFWKLEPQFAWLRKNVETVSSAADANPEDPILEILDTQTGRE